VVDQNETSKQLSFYQKVKDNNYKMLLRFFYQQTHI